MMNKPIPTVNEVQIGERTYIPWEQAAKIMKATWDKVLDLVLDQRIQGARLNNILILDRESVKQWVAQRKAGGRLSRNQARTHVERLRLERKARRSKTIDEIVPIVEDVQVDGDTYIMLEKVASLSDLPKTFQVQFGQVTLFNQAEVLRWIERRKEEQEQARLRAQRQQIEREALQKAIERGTLFS